MPSEPALRVVLRPPGREPYVMTLERLTQVVRMGRLANSLAKALDAKAGLETAVEQDVAKYVDRVDQIRRRKDEIFMKQHAALDVDVSDLAELEKDLEDFGKNDRSGDGANAYTGTAPPKL
jgi:hypothetical protein